MGTERQKFWAALRSPLPVCVRINKSMAGWRLLAQRISRLGGWTPLAWVPDELAWTVRILFKPLSGEGSGLGVRLSPPQPRSLLLKPYSLSQLQLHVR